MTQQVLEQVRELIKAKKYDEARRILRNLTNNPTAQKWLQKLDEIDPPKQVVRATPPVRVITTPVTQSKTPARNYTLVALLSGLVGLIVGLALGVSVIGPRLTNINATSEPTETLVAASLPTQSPTVVPTRDTTELTLTSVFAQNQTLEAQLSTTLLPSSVPPTAIPPATVVPLVTATNNSMGGWEVTTSTRAIDDTRIVTIGVESRTPVRTWLDNVTPILAVRCNGSELESLVFVGSQVESDLDGIASIRIRFDSFPAQSLRMSESTTGDALFFTNPREIVRQMLNARSMVFSFTPFNAATTETTFDLSGIGVAILPLIEACGAI
jgi:hypothetical protein